MGKTYTLRVYPAGMSRTVNRTIRISGSETLDTLCSTIIDSLDFDRGHMYEFCMDNKMYSKHSYQSAPQYREPSTRIKLERIHLEKGQNFSLHYDFGDDWMFTIHVQKIEEEAEKHAPIVLKATGTIEQYPYWDADEFYEGDEVEEDDEYDEQDDPE